MLSLGLMYFLHSVLLLFDQAYLRFPVLVVSLIVLICFSWGVLRNTVHGSSPIFGGILSLLVLAVIVYCELNYEKIK